MERLFSALIEHKDFNDSRPWVCAPMTFESAYVAPPHYAETTEILLCRDIIGDAFIGGRKYDMSGRRVFYIPPLTVHSFDYKPNSGLVWVVKLHPEMCRKYIDINAVLAGYERSAELLETEYFCYDELAGHVSDLCDDGDICDALRTILMMFSIFAKSSPKITAEEKIRRSTAAAKVNEIITWTEQNYGARITLDELSKRFGYNKSYFCEMFKSATGETYLKYLNNVRISAACAMLKAGTPVKETAGLCGYETDSHFISLFKKTVGITPKQYQLGKY